MDRSSIKLLVVGGCHVKGFPYNLEDSFTFHIVRELQSKNIEVVLNIYDRFLLKEHSRLKTIIAESRPDILICQCGNYEFSPDLRKIISKKNSFIKNKIIQKEKFKNAIEYDCSVNPVSYKIKMILKYVFNCLIGFKLVPYSIHESNIQSFFENISEGNIKRVFILSSLPTLDYSISKYRKKGSEILKRWSTKFGFSYIDIFSILQDKKENFYNPSHLNKKGQSIIGSTLAPIICESLNHKKSISKVEHNITE